MHFINFLLFCLSYVLTVLETLHPSEDPFSIDVSKAGLTQGGPPASTPRASSTFGSPGPPTHQTPLIPLTPAKDSIGTPKDPILPRPTTVMGGGEGYRTVAYFVNWGIYGRKYFPHTVPADKLTHVLYSFGDNREDGEVILTDQWSDIQIHYEGDSWNDQGNNLYGNLKQLYLLKKKNRNLKVLLSIGGWTYAHEQKHFDTPASTPQGRKKFADSCVQLIKDLGFDGIDIDWEYPRDQDQGHQLLLLLQAIRSAMDAYASKLEGETGTKPQFVLTIAAPAGADNYNNIPLGAIAQVLDFINLMAYDYSGSWDKAAGHQANLFPSTSVPACTPFNSQSVIDAYVSKGVPANKIVLGMPLYGRAFTNTDGIGKSYNGSGPGSWENGVWDFKALPQPGAQEYSDEESGASYSYDQNTRTLVSYDTLDMAKKKAKWIKQKGLGGAMWWELSGDRQGEGSIVNGVVAELGGPSSGRLEHHANWLIYPDSQYDNLRKGFPNN
ncbi:Chitinase 4 [Didymosphaeria variabile]|uniref:chitinase n=1 Tax=Didymosphaeria variabile TaxID=1932322 RepID=A0A9W8XES7_9PLEO|nr:Chitinase 4 [Didymosphaeria variabile]KAJ4348304.1 Chitinase 4 [Didymosphaeria variabile]